MKLANILSWSPRRPQPSRWSRSFWQNGSWGCRFLASGMMIWDTKFCPAGSGWFCSLRQWSLRGRRCVRELCGTATWGSVFLSMTWGYNRKKYSKAALYFQLYSYPRSASKADVRCSESIAVPCIKETCRLYSYLYEIHTTNTSDLIIINGVLSIWVFARLPQPLSTSQRSSGFSLAAYLHPPSTRRFYPPCRTCPNRWDPLTLCQEWPAD